MADRSSIEWTATVNPDGSVTPGASWNPIRARSLYDGKVDWRAKIGWHCERVSPGCKNCYAAGINKRLGTGFDYVAGVRDDKVEVFLDETVLMQPLHWKRARKIFVCSMTDLFGEFVSDEVIWQVFLRMAEAAQHTFLVLTKRADRLRGLCGPARAQFAGYFPWPLQNVRLGVSAEDQQRADERFASLCELGEAGWNTMCSLEPLIGPVVVPERYLALGNRAWVIVGGESGRNARPCEFGWIRSIIEDCREASVPCFVKQVGENYRFDIEESEWGGNPRGKGGDPSEWPADLHVREYPA